MFGRGKKRAGSNERLSWRRSFDHAGVVVIQSSEGEPLDSTELTSLLNQLEDEGYADRVEGGWQISWSSLYALMELPTYELELTSFKLPSHIDAVPYLESRGSLIDRNFSISIPRWVDAGGRSVPVTGLNGALLHCRDGERLLSKEAWRLLCLIREFQQRTDQDRDHKAQRKSWGLIRQAAIEANARLDQFLFRTVVLTPERLDIQLRKAELDGMEVVEVIPSFPGVPDDWIDSFDKLTEVRDRYDVPTTDGVVQVVITPQVKTVLSQIKKMPGRRVSGARAERFVSNPFASLGDDAIEVIDAEQFEQARNEAGLQYDRFTAYVANDAWGYPERVGLRIEPAEDAADHDSNSIHLFENDDELGKFIRVIRSRMSAGYELCAWEEYEFEILGDTEDAVRLLAKALEARSKPRILISYAQIYDLSSYSERISEIGVEKPYYSPFIAKKEEASDWFPENLVPVISWQPEGESEPVAVPITDEIKDQLRAKLNEARSSGKEELKLAGFPHPMPVREAEDILHAFDVAQDEARNGAFDPNKPRKGKASSARHSPVIKANIQSVDYEEARRDILLAGSDKPILPSSLRKETILKQHQLEGLAWLQHLYLTAPEYCRGCVLADDMGLGKTLQLLALTAWAYEQNPDLDPVLIVAPLSLLENWQEEAKRFFVDGALPIFTAYGNALRSRRVPRASIDAALQMEGMVSFLVPNWRGDAKLVLTTYETLRDLEFSFANEKWSIMVCDEAQRIKNPNAMITRAAKKQNVRFKIACTGTPVENTLADLWCLFDFIQPGMLGALNDFSRRYRRPIEAETEEQKARVEELRAKIEPQILRRTKKEVAKDLPEKRELSDCRSLPISAHQRNLYAQSVDLFRRRNEPGIASPFKNHLGLLHYLRLICTDPRRHGLDVFRPEPLDEYRARSPKLDWLVGALRAIRAREEKVIIFCEFRAIQRLLRHYIDEVFHVAPDIINGDTSASASNVQSRHKRIQAFQETPGFGVIILSPVAVGFGVNIQAANHVIHYTRTWNPAKEDQATDRAYRIGQEKDVFVYCPVVTAEDFTTFDVKLDQLLTRKRSLADDMLNGAGDIQPGDFDIEDVVPGGAAGVVEADLTIDDVLQMNPQYFECLIASIWQKRGYRTVERTAQSHDDGVDVVAISGAEGEIIQCKSSSRDNTGLNWDAIKDVVTGEAAYRARYPRVKFRKVCVTNQHFNDNACRHATLNDVELIDQARLVELLEENPVTLLDLDKVLHPDWGSFTG